MVLKIKCWYVSIKYIIIYAFSVPRNFDSNYLYKHLNACKNWQNSLKKCILGTYENKLC